MVAAESNEVGEVKTTAVAHNAVTLSQFAAQADTGDIQYKYNTVNTAQRKRIKAKESKSN